MIKKLFLSSVLFTLFISYAAVLVQPNHVSAANAADWQAGRIIDDFIFTDANAMTAQQVQEFLNQKVGTGGYGRVAGQCDTNGVGTSEYGGGTRAQYGAAHGNPAPFTCLRDYWEVPKTTPGPGIPASNYGGAPIPSGGQSAAQIIWNAAHQYNISPKTLLVTIQKESRGPLTTDDWPFKSQYTYAMGAHCPDTAACDENYAGFSMQIYESARLFRYYLDNMGQSWWPYKKPGVNNVLYNPNAGCGSSDVNIVSKATAALYTYTPYQPNQAALNNLYGSGDGCSAYGNRNFWRIFTDWFGTTYNPNYSWRLGTQYVYTDQTKTVHKGLSNLAPGERAYVGFTALNTGNTTWTNTGPNAVTLGTSGPLERSSNFSAGSSWLSSTRPALLKEASVAPGQTGTFEFWMTAPVKPGTGGLYNEHFNLVANGLAWFNDIGLYFSASVIEPTYSWKVVTQYAYTDATKTTPRNMNGLLPGDRVYVGFTAKNMGNVTWSNSGPNALLVGTESPKERSSTFSAGSSWLSSTRPALLKEASVAPGQTGTFEFWMTAPNSTGVYNERFNIVANGITWFNDTGLSYYANVLTPVYSWQMQSQYAYTDSSKATALNLATLVPGQKAYIGFTAKNTGNKTWLSSGPNALLVGTESPKERSSTFSAGSSWLSSTRPALLKEASVAPGQTGTFEFTITAPSTKGVYNERFNLIANDLAWLNDTGLSFYAKVN